MDDDMVVTGEFIPAAQEREINERKELAVAEYGDGLPWHPDHYESEIRGELRRGCESFLRAGRLLLVARECASHGEWSGMIGRLGMAPRQVQRMMEAARRIAKLPNASRATHLIEVAGTQSKLIELLSLPENEFAELAETGKTGSLRVDGIEAMTRDELRAAIREARDDMSAKDERAAVREREIDRLNKELRKARRVLDEATPDQTTQDLRHHASAAAHDVRAKIIARGDDVSSLRTRAEQLLSHGRDTGVDQGVFLAGLFAEIERDLAALRDELGIEATVAADGTPEWLKQAQAAGEV